MPLKRGKAGVRQRSPYRRYVGSVVSGYLLRHAQVFFASLGRLFRAPGSSLLTTTVIGIALALPTGLYIVLQNAQQISTGWDGSPQISLFLREEVSDVLARELAADLQTRDAVAEVRTIGRAEALSEFRRLSGFADALETLEENPLPAVLLIRPTEPHQSAEAARALADALGTLPEVELAQLDLQWVRRLQAIMQIAQRGVLVMAGLLALAVLVIIGNTIRLDIQTRREEIEITKLVGATDAFIRRPFLYNGLWYGVLGGLIAWLLLKVSLGLLQGPVERLAGLYHSGFELSGLGGTGSLVLLATSAGLGLLGSWVAVGHHLSKVEPGKEPL